MHEHHGCDDNRHFDMIDVEQTARPAYLYGLRLDPVMYILVSIVLFVVIGAMTWGFIAWENSQMPAPVKYAMDGKN